MKYGVCLVFLWLQAVWFHSGDCTPVVLSPVLESVDIDNILGNPKAVEYHIKCVVYDGHCDKVGAEVKRLLPEVGFECSGCTADQKMKLDRIEHHVQQNYPQAWQDMEKKYGKGGEVASFSIGDNPAH